MKMVEFNLEDITVSSLEEEGTVFISPSEGQIGIKMPYERFAILDMTILTEGRKDFPKEEEFKEALKFLYEKLCENPPE